MEAEEIDKMVLSCMKGWEQGYWHGWEYLEEQITFFFGLNPTIKEIKQSVKRLVKANLVECVSIFDESNLKLKGKGYIIKQKKI